MRRSLFYNPLDVIERLALMIARKRRMSRLKNTAGQNLKLGHVDSLELLELIREELALQRDPVIYDIGANIGTWTLLAKSIFPAAAIHAFEPLKSHIDEFLSSCNGLSNVHIHAYGVGNKESSELINVSSFSDSSSLLKATPLEFEQYGIKELRQETVMVKRIEDLINAQQIPVPDIIKLDIQGFELEAIKGVGDYLAKVKYIICEVSFQQFYYGQASFLEIASYLNTHGFDIYAFGNNVPSGKRLYQADLLFKRSI